MRDRSLVYNFSHSDHPTHRQRMARMARLVASKYGSVVNGGRLIVNTQEFDQQKRRLIAPLEDPDMVAKYDDGND